MSLSSKDYLQLKQLKLFLQKNKSVKANFIQKDKVGQMMINNKFFHDFDGDGEITFADYNIAWNWLMQGKPTDIDKMSETEPVTKKLPYESVQHSSDHILLDNREFDTSDITLTATSTKPRFTFKPRTKVVTKEVQPKLIIKGETLVNKPTTRSVVEASSVQTSEIVEDEIGIEENLKVQTTDYVELNKVKNFLLRYGKIKITELHKRRVGQYMLNNKFFHDFDGDGEITFSDYNIAWNWLMQGKPTSLKEFAENTPPTLQTSDIPYQRVQDTLAHILLDQPSDNLEERLTALGEMKPTPKKLRVKLSPHKKHPTKSKEPRLHTLGDAWNVNYFSDDTRLVSSFSVPATDVEKTNLITLSADYTQLEEVRNFLKVNTRWDVTDISKDTVGQSLINNKFFHDFDMDGEITFSDYNIAWNWVMQGKPTDIIKFAKNKSATPDTHRLPHQSTQDGDINILLDNRLVVYDRGEGGPDPDQLVSGLGLSFDTGVQIISTGIEEESSDFNEDGEIDEVDLQILECYIMSRPSDICEYNRDRGECPEASKLPNMLTSKFACDTSYYYGDVHLPGDDEIEDADIEYYMSWLLGEVPSPDVNTLKFILSNNWVETPYRGPGFREVLRDCNIRDGLTQKSLHSTGIYRVDYRDYLIMKEWLRLGKPNFKGHQSDYDALTWFNANSAPGTPLACKLPFEVYMDIGASCYTFEDTYVGVENL